MPAQRKNYRDAVGMYERGLSIEDIATAFGVSRQSMWKTLKRRGVKFRPNVRKKKESHFYRGGAVRNAVFIQTRAVERGILTVQPCEGCKLLPKIVNGRQRIQAHHDDYNDLLKVRWLCSKCHHDWHKRNKPIPRRKKEGKE